MAEMMIDGVAFNVVVEGQDDAPAILVAHSLGADLTQWDPQMDSLARRFRVIRYDSRGHGHTEATPGPYSVEQLGRDALAVLDALGVKKTHYMGLSLGGIVGMWLLANAPERIDRAILANTSACFGHADLWNGRIRHALSEGMDSLAGPTMDRWFTRDFHESDPGAIERIAARFRATSPEGYAATAAALRDADLREAIRGVQNRVLVIVGTQDPAATPAAGGLIADSIRGSRLVALDAAHLSNIEAANAFNRAMVSFLTAPEAVPARAPAKKAGKKAAAKKPAKKAGKKAAKTATKKTSKKTAAKKTSKKVAKKTAAKKSVKTSAKKAEKKTAKKVAKKAAKTTSKKTAKKATSAKSAKKMAKKAVKATRQTAKKTAKKPARKSAKKARR
jgi:3-oxoadipate enol-lactonase